MAVGGCVYEVATIALYTFDWSKEEENDEGDDENGHVDPEAPEARMIPQDAHLNVAVSS